MIQLNLLPSVKQDYIKTQRIKRLMVTISFIASAAALLVLVVALSSVYVVQKKAISDLSSDVDKYSKQLRDTPHISDILTVQSQLNSLSALNNSKPLVSRMFGYLTQLTPTQTTISDLHTDFTADTISINGNAPSLDVVNTYVDTLKFTNYALGTSQDTKPAFTNVILTSFSRGDKAATYTISCSFDPAIFDVTQDVSLKVGGKAQDVSQQPSIIFKTVEQ